MSPRPHPRSTARSEHYARRAARRLEKRDELLAAALDAIQRLGEDTSMEAMAAEAGITKPILYRYFGDRHGVIQAVADRFADRLVDRLELALDAEGSPAERIEQAIDSYVGFIEEDPALYGFLTSHAPVGSSAARSVVERVATTVAQRLGEDLRTAGVDSAPATWWAYGIVGLVHQAGARWAADPTIPRHRLIEYLTTLTRFGLEGQRPVTSMPQPPGGGAKSSRPYSRP